MPDVFDILTDKNGTQRFRKNNQFTAKDKVPAVALERLTADNVVDENGLIIVDKKSDESKAADAAENATPETPETTPPTNPDEEDKADDTPSTPDPDDQDEPTPPADAPGTDPDHETTNPAGAAAPEADPDEDEPDPDPAPAPTKPKPAAKPSAKVPKFVSKAPQSKPGMGFPRKNGKTVDIFDGSTPHTHLKLVGGYTVPLSDKSFNERSEKEIEDKLIDMGFELINYNRNEALDGSVDSADLDEDGDGLTDDDV